jgi:hypothetical protein
MHEKESKKKKKKKKEKEKKGVHKTSLQEERKTTFFLVFGKNIYPIGKVKIISTCNDIFIFV